MRNALLAPRGPLAASVRLLVAGLGLAVFLALPGCEAQDAADVVALGPAPAFKLPLLTGGEVELEKLRGKTVILDFWATWCPPCEVQMPILDEVWRDRKDGDLMILGVSIDTDPPATVARWIEERGFSYPIAAGDQSLAVQYGILGFPSLVVIDPSGQIQARHTGVWSREEIEDHLEAIRAASLAVGG
jgi:peroxiredoxin